MRKDSCRLNPVQDSAAAVRGRAVCCDVAAQALTRASVDSLAELRRNPEPLFGFAPPPALLKHADEQTAVGLAAVYHACRDRGVDPTGFRDWGVLAAPRFLGQSMMAASLLRFQAEGAWGVSPHVIPHRSLHSISGTISHALKIKGPNLGVGGGPGGAAEAFLTAAALLERGRAPGVWVVLTLLHPDAPLSEAGAHPPGAEAVAWAVALTPAHLGWPGPRCRIVVGGSDGAAGPDFDLFHLHSAYRLAAERRGEAVGVGGRPRIEFEWPRPTPAYSSSAIARLTAAGRLEPTRIPSGAEIER